MFFCNLFYDWEIVLFVGDCVDVVLLIDYVSVRLFILVFDEFIVYLNRVLLVNGVLLGDRGVVINCIGYVWIFSYVYIGCV